MRTKSRGEQQPSARNDWTLSLSSSKDATKAASRSLASLKEEMDSLSHAIGSVPKTSQTWQVLNTYLQGATEELDAVQQDMEIGQYSKSDAATSGNWAAENAIEECCITTGMQVGEQSPENDEPEIWIHCERDDNSVDNSVVTFDHSGVETSKHALVDNATPSCNASHQDHMRSITPRPRTKSRKFVVEVGDDGEVLQIIELKKGRSSRPKQKNWKAFPKSRGRSKTRSTSRNHSSDKIAAKSDDHAKTTQGKSPFSKPEAYAKSANFTEDTAHARALRDDKSSNTTNDPITRHQESSQSSLLTTTSLSKVGGSDCQSSLRVSNASVSFSSESRAASKTDLAVGLVKVERINEFKESRCASEKSFSDVISTMDQVGSIHQLGTLSSSMVSHDRSLPSRQQSRGRQACITRLISDSDLPGFRRARSLSRSHTSAANNSRPSASISKGLLTFLPRRGQQAPRHARSLSRARDISGNETLPRQAILSTQSSVVSQSSTESLASTLLCMASGYQKDGPNFGNLAEEGEDPLMNSTITIFEDDDAHSLVSDPTCLMDKIGDAFADDSSSANLAADEEDQLMNSAITIFEDGDDSSVLSDFTCLKGKGSPLPPSTCSDDDQDNELKQKQCPTMRTRTPSTRARGKREHRPLGKSDITKETVCTDESIIEIMESKGPKMKQKSSAEAGCRFKSRMSWF